MGEPVRHTQGRPGFMTTQASKTVLMDRLHKALRCPP